MFVWCDLSTFDRPRAQKFYAECLGWRFPDSEESYAVAYEANAPIAALYTMPDTFQRIGMPSFWMSYIQVDDVEKTVEAARAAGGRVELGPQPGPDGSLIALIRDPAGAGFTCYQGDPPGPAGPTRTRPVWHELHVSDLSLVRDFYRQLFGWAITPTAEDARHLFTDESGTAVGGVRITPNSIKGDKEYWGVYFPVPNLDPVQARIEAAGGRCIAAEPIDGRPTVLAFDTQDAAFYLVGAGVFGSAAQPSGRPTWRAWIGLLFVAGAVLSSADWLWGLLFLSWILPDLRSGSTHFLDHVTRAQNPLTYWSIVGTWILLSIYLLVFGWG